MASTNNPILLHPSVWVTMTIGGNTEAFYQPSGGGWRCSNESGPLRCDERGMIVTYESLEAAAAALALLT